MSKRAISNILLLITAIIWGSAFVAQKVGTQLEPFTYNGIRTFIGGLVLLPLVPFLSRITSGDLSGLSNAEKAARDRNTWLGGLACGVVLFAASSLQQFGMFFDTDAGKAGFITALYIVLVPVIGILIGKKIRPVIWLCVAIGAAGFYLLTMAGKGEGFHLRLGDFILLLGAICFSLHILTIDHFSPRADAVKMSCIQFLVAGGIGIICMFIFETPRIDAILALWFPILYAGILSSGMGYTLQIIAQQHAEPASASLIMSLESVFAVITGAIILHEKMTVFELLGCIVIFAAVIIAQLPSKEERLATKQ